MAWKRGYYYRNKRIDGKVVTEYLGSGYSAQLFDQLNQHAQAEAERKHQAWRAIQDEQQRLDQMIDAYGRLADAYVTALLLVNGYRQHKRSEWRKRREHTRTGDSTASGT